MELDRWQLVLVMDWAGWKRPAESLLNKLCDDVGRGASFQMRRPWEAEDLAGAAKVYAVAWLKQEREERWGRFTRGEATAHELAEELKKEAERGAGYQASWERRRRDRPVKDFSDLLRTRTSVDGRSSVLQERKGDLRKLSRRALALMRDRKSDCYAPIYADMWSSYWFGDGRLSEDHETRKRMSRALRKGLMCAAQELAKEDIEKGQVYRAVVEVLEARGPAKGRKQLFPLAVAIRALLLDQGEEDSGAASALLPV